MPTQPPPQPSVSESSARPAHPPAHGPLSGRDAAAGRPTRGDTLFHLLVERGWEAGRAYTADQRIRAMTSEIVADGLQPVLEELRQMRETMATKTDLADLRREMAEREARLLKWMFGAMLAQTAVIVGFVVGVVPLLR